MLWGNRTKLGGSGHHNLPCSPGGLLSDLEGTGVSFVDCSNWNVNDNVIRSIGKECRSTLIELIITAPTITDVSPLSTLRKLRRLTLINADPDLLPPGSLAALSPLHSLSSSCTTFNSQLAELNLSGCGSALNDEAMITIVQFHGARLQILNIARTRCGDLGAMHIGSYCHELLRVDLSHTLIKGKGMNAILDSNSKLVSVISAGLEHCSGRVALVHVEVDKVAAFKHQLIVLSLRGCQSVRNACCYWMNTFQSLRDLDVSGCRLISDAGVVELSKLSRLERLRARGLPLITTVGASVLLRELRKMQCCDISGCIRVDDHPFELWSRAEEVHFL